MNIYDLAHQLARALKESQEYKTYMHLKEKVSENEELAESINDFHQRQFEIQTHKLLGTEPETDMMDQIQKLYEILLKDPLAAQYLQAEFAFTMMYADVCKILQDAVRMGPDAK